MHEHPYLRLIQSILQNGEAFRTNRTGVDTTAIFGGSLMFDLQNNQLPLITTKKIHWKSVVGELLWFLSGCKGGIAGLKADYGVSIWDEWQPEEDKGKRIAYKNMTTWEYASHINQLANVIEQIKTDPNSRRHVVSMWNPSEVHSKQNVLDPCHTLFQFYVSHGAFLQCQMYQRSADMFLGVPFNIASYALLTHLVAHCTGLKALSLNIVFGDVHIYDNHLPQVREQLSREPYPMPTIALNPRKTNIFAFTPQDIELINYQFHPAIKADIAI